MNCAELEIGHIFKGRDCNRTVRELKSSCVDG